MVDLVVDRRELAATIDRCLRLLFSSAPSASA
jgi:hypothetical protein